MASADDAPSAAKRPRRRRVVTAKEEALVATMRFALGMAVIGTGAVIALGVAIGLTVLGLEEAVAAWTVAAVLGVLCLFAAAVEFRTLRMNRSPTRDVVPGGPPDGKAL